MISQFSFRAPALRGSPAPPSPSPGAEGGRDPLAELLGSLRGREVTLLVGTREVTGRVVLADPVTLVGRSGEVTVVAPGQVHSVQF